MEPYQRHKYVPSQCHWASQPSSMFHRVDLRSFKMISSVGTLNMIAYQAEGSDKWLVVLHA
ncbi:hypothetical protein LB504_003421 [Fusarium proliferatum]|nr:hypothetical protein LB504_003421 [Fusarium proliferatum]